MFLPDLINNYTLQRVNHIFSPGVITSELVDTYRELQSGFDCFHFLSCCVIMVLFRL